MRKTFLLLIFGLFSTYRLMAQSIDYDAWKNASETTPYDVTSLMVNPSGTGNNGWSRNSEDAAAGYNKHNTEFASDVYDDTGIESWYWNPVLSADLIWQDVKGLMPGVYRVKAFAVAQIYNNSGRKGELGNGSFLFAGDQKVPITSNKWQELTVTATVDDSQTLRIGICADETNENDWVSIAQVKLECIEYAGFSATSTLVLDEKYDVSAAREAGIYDIILYRTLHDDKYTPFCVPFEMTASDVNSYFSEVLEVTGLSASGTSYEVTTSSSDMIKAGTPYLVKAKKSGRQRLEIKETPVTPLNESQPVVKQLAGVKIIAAYRSADYVAGAYLLSDDNMLVKHNGVERVKGYCFYGIK